MALDAVRGFRRNLGTGKSLSFVRPREGKMNDFVAAIRPYLELLYFLAGVLLVIGIALTYVQVRVLKLDLKTRNSRVAKEQALSAANRYFDRYVPLANKYLKDRGDIPSYKGPIGDFSASSLPSSLKELSEARFKVMSWADAMNQLEAVAAPFCLGVAEEESGFKIIGRSFCRTVELHYDLIALSRPESTATRYDKIVELYQLWTTRISRKETELEHNRLGQRLSALPDRSIPPIGREV